MTDRNNLEKETLRQTEFDETDNAGRLAGEAADAGSAREQINLNKKWGRKDFKKVGKFIKGSSRSGREERDRLL